MDLAEDVLGYIAEDSLVDIVEDQEVVVVVSQDIAADTPDEVVGMAVVLIHLLDQALDLETITSFPIAMDTAQSGQEVDHKQKRINMTSITKINTPKDRPYTHPGHLIARITMEEAVVLGDMDMGMVEEDHGAMAGAGLMDCLVTTQDIRMIIPGILLMMDMILMMDITRNMNLVKSLEEELQEDVDAFAGERVHSLYRGHKSCFATG